MHKAFWDVLEAQLSENPPSYNHAIKLLAEIKQVRQLLLGHRCSKEVYGPQTVGDRRMTPDWHTFNNSDLTK